MMTPRAFLTPRCLLLAAVLALLALGLLFSHGDAAPAQAQSSTLVSNVGQTTFTPTITIGTNPVAQKFTTGTNTGGYTLASLDIEFAVAVGTPANLRAELWSATSGGAPDSKLASLTVPSTVGVGAVAFNAPSNTSLDASTSYFMVVYRSGDTTGSLRTTRTNNEDTGSASGWSIGDTRHGRSGTTWSTNTVELKIRVKGAAKTPTQSTAPAAPTNLRVGPNDAAIGVEWTAPSGTLTGYDLHYTSAPATGTNSVSNTAAASGSDPSMAWVAVSSPPGPTDTYAGIDSLDNGTTYRVRLRAKNTDGNGAWAFGTGTPNIVIAWPGPTQTIAENDTASIGYRLNPSRVSAAVSGTLTYAAGTTNGASLSADLQSGYATTFSASAANQYARATLALPVNDAVNEEHETFTVTINAGTGYVVGTQAKITVTINDNDPPAAPSGLSLTAGSGKLSASWTKPAGPVTGYQLRHKVASAMNQAATTPGDPSTGWVTSTASITTTSAEITGLTNGTAYHVQVRATDGQTQTGNGYGAWSASQSGTPTAAPPTQSSNANLSGLTAKSATSATGTFSALALSPSTFSASTTAYTASVPNTITHVKLTPTKAHTGASIKVGKGASLTAVTSGTESSAIALDVGSNAIKVEVTAQDGTTKVAYTVTVTRAAAGPGDAAPPPNMAVGLSGDGLTVTGWLNVTWGWPGYTSTAAIVRWRLKDADPNTAGDQPGPWAPENGVLVRSEQHAARSATLPPWDCANCVAPVPGKTYEVDLRLVTATGYSDWGRAGEGVPIQSWPLALSVDSGAIPHGGSVTVTARLGAPATRLMEVRFDTEGDNGAARWGPDCDWEHGTINLIAAGQTETSRKLCAVAAIEAPSGVVWSATLTPVNTSGDIGCEGKTDCDARLTDNSFTVGGAAYHLVTMLDLVGTGLWVQFNDYPNAELQALKFCVGTTGHSIQGASNAQFLTSASPGWTAGAPVLLKVAESCGTAGVTMTVTAEIGTDIEATPIRVRALGPNPPTAITLSADEQAVANGGPVTVTARLDRPTASGLTVNLGINGLGAAWWDHCDPPRRYRGTWGGKVIEIPPGGQEATAELCVMWRDGPPLEIWAWSDAPRLDAKTLSLLAPASLALRSLTVSSTDPQEGLPENAVQIQDASNDYAFSVPRAVSSVTVKPAAAYETTSVRVNGQAVDDTTPSVDVPLDVGDNTIRIEVSAPAVPAAREYTLTVTRMEAAKEPETQVLARPECDAETGPLCGIALSAGSEAVAFSPDFTRDTTSYRATVPAGTTSVTLTPDYADGTSVFAGARHGGTTYTRPTRVRPSGTAVELALAPDGGATELWVMVSGSGGMTTYSIDVTAARPEPKTYSVSAASTAAEGGNATLTVTLSEAAPTGGVALTVTAGYPPPADGSTATADDVGSIASPVTVGRGPDRPANRHPHRG